MVIFYLLESLIFLCFGLVLVFKSVLIKKLFVLVQERNLFFILGIIEIILGLLTLNFRHETRLLMFVFLVGLLLFIDGVFYLLLSEKLRSTIDWLLNLEEKNYRNYGFFIILVSVGLMFSVLMPAS
ncbi:MAG: DUF2065 family protein [Candidatus Marinimicrobia bacterium]|nr:DUF2065 family protein [Candidatus Neomarinimicrobiota bacterium]